MRHILGLVLLSFAAGLAVASVGGGKRTTCKATGTYRLTVKKSAGTCTTEPLKSEQSFRARSPTNVETGGTLQGRARLEAAPVNGCGLDLDFTVNFVPHGGVPWIERFQYALLDEKEDGHVTGTLVYSLVASGEWPRPKCTEIYAVDGTRTP
jgi:hypothetical protein